MGFGLSGKVDIPKVETPKIEVPKLDPGAAAAGIAGAAKAAVSAGAGAVSGAVGAAKGLASGAIGAVGKAIAPLSSVAGALAQVAVSFKGAAVDLSMEPHAVLEANASYGDTQFEKGNLWIRVDLTPEEAKASTDALHLFTPSERYHEQMKISDFKESSSGTVDIVFRDAPMDQRFSLMAVSKDGDAQLLFDNVKYGELDMNKLPVSTY